MFGWHLGFGSGRLDVGFRLYGCINWTSGVPILTCGQKISVFVVFPTCLYTDCVKTDFFLRLYDLKVLPRPKSIKNGQLSDTIGYSTQVWDRSFKWLTQWNCLSVWTQSQRSRYFTLRGISQLHFWFIVSFTLSLVSNCVISWLLTKSLSIRETLYVVLFLSPFDVFLFCKKFNHDCLVVFL